ncbi:MAG: CHASE domain-containing protein [Verrucomicrobiales bacterium]|nr:CHASE domain-containing protein [Verrucomicrobiales bacterium]
MTSNSQKRIPPAWIGFVLAGGVVLSLVLFFMIRGGEMRDLQTKAGNLAHEKVEKLHVDMLRSMEVLNSVSSLYAAQGKIEREQFHEFVRQALLRQPEIQALSWNPRVSDAGRMRFETMATNGCPGYELRELTDAGEFVPAAKRSEYVPVLFIEPIDGNASALGYDLDSNARRLASIEKARDTGLPVATAPIRLAQEHGDKKGFLVLLPVYQGESTPVSVAERRERLVGFAVAVFRVVNLVDEIFQQLKTEGIEVRVFDDSPDGELIYDNVTPAIEKPVAGAEKTIPLEVAGRRWVVTFAPTPQFVAAQSHAQAWSVLAVGVLFTLLTVAYLYGGWRRTQEIAAANAALHEEVAVRQRAEAAAESANQAKSDFLASMSHEIRTPLNAILGYSQIMQRDRQLTAEQRDAIGSISASGQHLLGLINEILDLSKIEAGRMELNPVDFDLAALGQGLTATFQPLCAEKRIGFRVVFDGGGKKFVVGDEGKLRQVLINLLGNAVKFTNVGEVFFRCKNVADDAWLFEVIDTGLGIPEAERANIFKPFQQGANSQHQGGTGLGLAIAQRQVELLGGKLELQSERGIGSRFFFQIALPAAEAEAPQLVPLMPQRLKPGRRLTALVVDDRKENRDILGQMLTQVGCEVSFAASGAEALRVAREQSPQIVFLDLLLPGMSGVATARALLSEPDGATLKIVAHTASALTQYRDEAQQAGCVDFIVKPIRSERLYECLRIHLGAEFEYADQQPEAKKPSAWDAGPMYLPDELYARLATAAELHSTTVLKSCLIELRQLGPGAEQLAEHIRHLMRSYDMDGILRLISRATVPAVSEVNLSHHG